MRDLMSGLLPPIDASDPREILRWVRRMEILGGVAAIVAGIALWNDGWFHWVLPVYALAGFLAGYLVDGVETAIATGAVLTLSALLGVWLFLRRFD